MASDKSDILAQHLSHVPAHRALIRALEHRLFAGETLMRPVLDIGCGDGYFAAAAFPGGIDMGLDITQDFVAEAGRNGPYLHVVVASGTALPCTGGAFRTVISNCTVEHIADIDSVVHEIARVLAPEGRFIFTVPNDRFTDILFIVRWLKNRGLPGLADWYGRWWNRRAVHHHLDAPEVWRLRLARHGLMVDKWIHYMSVEATRAFELCHYYAIPALCCRKLTGRWLLNSSRVRAWRAYRWLKPYADEPWPAVGACTFFVAHK